MGNCINTKAIPEENQKNERPREAKTVNKTASRQSSTFRTAKRVEDGNENAVRFRFGEKDASNDIIGGESCRETKSGVVRIRLVLTQNELNQIFSGELNHTASAEQLLSVIKSRSKRDCQGSSSSDSDGSRNWMPVLESIPEDI